MDVNDPLLETPRVRFGGVIGSLNVINSRPVMRRADRLFRIAQELDTERYTTARFLAEVLEVSERTIYRDIDTLSGSGIPIEAMAGAGYRLCRGFRLPPMMFDPDELTAILLGIRMVQGWSDPGLAAAAARALRKVDAALPERLRPALASEDLLVPDFHVPPALGEHIGVLRAAIGDRTKVRITYAREDGARSERSLWPLGLFYWGQKWTFGAWCELRGDFRHFRVDRIEALEITRERFTPQAGRTLQDFLAAVRAEGS